MKLSLSMRLLSIRSNEKRFETLNMLSKCKLSFPRALRKQGEVRDGLEGSTRQNQSASQLFRFLNLYNIYSNYVNKKIYYRNLFSSEIIWSAGIITGLSAREDLGGLFIFLFSQVKSHRLL